MDELRAVCAELREREELLLDPAVQRSAEMLDDLLAIDFLEFGHSGRVYTKQDILRELPARPALRMTLSDFTARLLAPGVALTTYRSYRYDESGREVARSLRSSIWIHRDGTWRLTFHQGTPAAPPDPKSD